MDSGKPFFNNSSHDQKKEGNNDYLMSVSPRDVLCGRNRTAFQHPGNRRFRVLVSMYIQSYVSVGITRKGKAQIIENITQAVQDYGGRFVQVSQNGVTVEELPQKKIYEKVGQPLRDMAQARSVTDTSWEGESTAEMSSTSANTQDNTNTSVASRLAHQNTESKR
jgi:hypothetical protein